MHVYLLVLACFPIASSRRFIFASHLFALFSQSVDCRKSEVIVKRILFFPLRMRMDVRRNPQKARRGLGRLVSLTVPSTRIALNLFFRIHFRAHWGTEPYVAPQ
jgi:hypothetical protein